MVRPNVFVARLFVALLLPVSLLVGLSGCGGSSSCDGVSCDFGVCKAGACVNPKSCQSDYDCVPGSSCSADHVCKTTTLCAEDLDCVVGVCKGGSCVNPKSCQSNDDCLPKTYCADDGTCQPDPCNTFICTQGQCKRGTQSCESKDTCTVDTEATDCIDGEQCLDGKCYDEQGYCEALDCQRGECSFADRGCVNADDCAGDDNNCADGYYCNGDNECAEDKCVANNVDCSSGGVCVPAVGECQDASPCSTSTDCIAGHVCIDGTCTLADMACGDPGCPGNQICAYDPTTMTASCKEATNCETSLGCLNGRQCAGGVCMEPVTCVPDRFESNDDEASATNFDTAASARAIAATVCSGDIDYYTFDTHAIPNFAQSLRGTLVVTAEYAHRDAGLGEVEMELFDPDGNSVDTATSGAHGKDGVVEIRHNINAAHQGVYTVRLADHGDVSQAGVTYTLSVDVVADDVDAACTGATTLAPSQSVTANINDPSSTGLGSTCTGIHDPKPENVFTFTLTDPSNVVLRAKPNASSTSLDLAISVRRACERVSTEEACVNDAVSGNETLSALLPAGTYYAIVEMASGTLGGTYTMSMSSSPAFCTSAQSSCSDANTAQVCTGGTSFSTKTCALGCDPRTGTCLTGPGDTCEQATEVQGNFTDTITWSDHTNQYEMPSGSCVPTTAGDTRTRGADAVYAVTVQPGWGLAATLDFPSGEYGAIYLLRGCFSPTASCVAGANGSTANGYEVDYVNDTANAQTLYVVADSAGGGQSTAELTIQTGEVVCTPGVASCNSDQNVIRCNGAGTGTVVEDNCGYGCAGGVCNPPPNDKCQDATALTSGQAVTDKIDAFVNNTDPGTDCTGSATDGPDAFYSIATPQDNMVVSVQVDSDFDARVYALDSCGSAATGCVAGVDDTSGSGTETLQFYAPSAGRYLIGVDTASGQPSGNFTITADVLQPQCTPGQIEGCSTTSTGVLDYCNAVGLDDQFTCPSGSCSNGACDNAAGDVCLDAIPALPGNTYSGTFAGANDDIDPQSTDSCIFLHDLYGKDIFYSVPLNAGDVLDARLTTQVSNATVYVLSDCSRDPSKACEWGRSDKSSVKFYAPTSGTYYVVVDSTSSSTTAAYSLELSVQPGGICQPGGVSCDPSSGVLSHCDATGTTLRPSVTCANGCSGQSCNPPPTPNDTCAGAMALGGAARIVDSWARFTGSYDPAGSCNITYASGPEAVYSLDMQPGDVLSAELVSFDTINYPRLYVATDCSDVGGTCVAGAQDSGQPVSVDYYSPNGGTVYIFADVDWSFANDPFMLDVDVRPAECTPGDSQCLDANTAETCNSYHVYEHEHCPFGCGGVGCNPPPNDQCGTATIIPKDDTWHTYTGPIDAYADDYDLSSASSSCTGSGSTGPDALYAIDLSAGDVVEADWTTPNDASLWITTSCPNNVEDSCVAGVDDGSNNGHLVYTAPTAGRYYIVGDVSAATATGNFQLRVRGITPQCDFNSTAPSCTTSNTLTTCVSPGVYSDQTCDFGCSNGACNPQTNDTCPDALDVSGGGSFSGNFADLNADYSPSGYNCTGFSEDGPDAAYVLTLSAGQTVTADMTSATGTDIAVYIVTDCTDVTNTCLDGSDSVVSSGTESASYTATTAQTVYIIADSYSSSTSSGTYALDVSVSP